MSATLENTNTLDVLLEAAAGDSTLSMALLFAAAIATDAKSDEILNRRFEALGKLKGWVNHLQSRGYVESLICNIIRKKGQMILDATTKSELFNIMNPRAPHYDGCKFITSKYLLPEEELVAWSEASLKGPLLEPAYRRYRELFRQVFPEEATEFFGNSDLEVVYV